MKHWPFYVYIHRREDTGAPFYVGKGTTEIRGLYNRAHCTGNRSEAWHRIAEWFGCEVEIFAHCPTNAAVLTLESRMINEFAKTYRLVNAVKFFGGVLRPIRRDQIVTQFVPLLPESGEAHKSECIVA